MTLLDAWWIQMLGMLAAAAVFLCGITGARTVPGIVLSGIAWPLASLRGLPWFGRSLRIAGTGARTPALVRTVVWSLLGLGVFGTIFASANPVFGSWVDQLVPNLTFNDLVGRAFLACFVFAATLGAAYLALNPAEVDVLGDRRPAPLANRFEWLVPVLVVDAVFLAFIAAQARALIGGRDYIEATTGLTYADYVHQGFGQLTLATALTVLVVWVASRRVGPDAPRTGVVVRLGRSPVRSDSSGGRVRAARHERLPGRLRVHHAATVRRRLRGLARVRRAGDHGRRGSRAGQRLPRIALVSGAVGLIGLAAINPDAWVAERNIDRYEATGDLDLRYLQSLSADAAPVIVERLPEEVAGCVVQDLTYNSLKPEVLDDARAWNLGRSRAEDAIGRIDLPAAGAGDDDACAGVWASFEE